MVPNYSRTDGRDLGVDLIEFDASKSEAIYSGSSVQVPAIQALIIIKVWIALGCTVEEAPKISFDFLAEKSNPTNPLPRPYGVETVWDKVFEVIAPAPTNSLSITACPESSGVRLPIMFGLSMAEHNWGILRGTRCI